MITKHHFYHPDGSRFFTRWTIFKCRWFTLKLHRFEKSDNEFHDHPWPFVSIVLWGKYLETFRIDGEDDWTIRNCGNVAYRPARWIHRVEVDEPCWTLCLTFGKQRQWGFWVDKDYLKIGNRNSNFPGQEWVPIDEFVRAGRARKVTVKFDDSKVDGYSKEPLVFDEVNDG